MSPISHSILADATAKKLNTPLKASVVLLTSVILASCGSDGSSTSYYSAPTPMADSDTGDNNDDSNNPTLPDDSTNEDLEKAKAEAEAERQAKEQAQAEAEAERQAKEQAQAEAEAAKQEAQKLKTELEEAKAQAEQAKAEAEQAKQELEETLNSGSGNSEALQAAAEEKAKQAEEALQALQTAEAAAQEAIAAADAKAQQAQDIINAATDAAAAAEIKNAPEADKSGVQTLNVNAGPLGTFNTTTRDFAANDTSVQARSDVASDNLLPAVEITTSSDDDAEVSNGFKQYDGEALISITSPIKADLPLTYSSVYKDYEDDMRIGHIDGSAALGDSALPVNGAAVIGNATVAENVPTEGTAGYTGDATYRKMGIGNAIEFGSSVFTADFVAKKLDGTLSFNQAGNIGLTAGINGNQFSGSADDNAGYATEGGFYGGDAQYLGGVYEGNGAQGTYGAKSDAQTAAEQAAVNARAAADAVQSQIDALKAEAEQVKAAAEQAKADAEKAQLEAEKAKERAENANNNAGNEEVLNDALARAEAAENAAATAQAAQQAAESAKVAAENALAAAQAAADKAVGEAKAEAEKLVAEAKAEAEAANTAAEVAKAEADAAKDAANKARAEKDRLVAEANAKVDKAEQEALQAQQAAEAANKVAAEEKAKAAAAQKEAETAKSELAAAQAALAEAEQVLADALAAGGGNTDALQAEVDRRDAALKAANEKAAAAQQAAAEAIAAADKQVADAQAALQAATDAAAAAEIKNAPEADKSGVQTLNVNAGPLGTFNMTTRDFAADDTSVQARSDVASDNLLPAVEITTSSDNDAEVSNGFKQYDGEALISITSPIKADLPLTYSSIYKDYEDDMRIGHIDGSAALGDSALPVNGAAVIGNATVAENVPTEGTAGYTGDATYRKMGIGNAIEFGTSVFTADFVAKKLDGTLSFNQAGSIGLTAGINGNQFSGSADDNAGYATEGGFYGGDAQYLGGVYEGNGAQGTYGAKSDAQTAAEQAAEAAAAAAEAAQAALAAEQVQAEAAQAAADKAQEDAVKAQEALAKAEEALANAGEGGNGGLAAALARAAAAEEAQAAAEEAAVKAQEAEAAAKSAQQSAEAALVAAQEAADKAIGEAKAEADAAVEAAQAEVNAAKAEAEAAKTEAAAAKAAAQTAIAEANASAEQAQQQVAAAQAEANAAKEQAAAEKVKAESAQAEAEKAKSDLADAQAALAEAEQALADALAAGGGNTDALEAAVARKEAALQEALAKASAAEQAAEEAIAAVDALVIGAEQAAEQASTAATAATIKNSPEADKSGVQTINVGASVTGLLGDFITTTRDFEIAGDSLQARADIASDDLLPVVDVVIFGEGDTELANGFMSHEDNTEITTDLGVLPLVYTSIYKNYSDDMLIGHIDGNASLSDTKIPVNGAAVIGNATKAENVPTEGSVSYSGDATYRALGVDNDIEFGKSAFTADFVAKKLDGTLSFNQAGNIGLTAGINGNQFSGSADDNAGYATEGGFYGGDAQYIGGIYEGNGAQGTYGAKSDTQTAAEQAAAEAQSSADAAQAELAAEQARAAAAQAAAAQAQEDAVKAQEALDKAQEALANAGEGGDGGLAAAIERAEAAEAAEAAAIEAAETAKAAQEAAEQAQEAAEQAQEAAEQALAAEKIAAAQAIGEAKAEADAAVEAAQAEVDAAKAEAEAAKTEAAAALVATTEAEQARDAAILAKEEAEARAKAAEEALAAELETPPAPVNPDAAASTTITGVQSNNIDGYQESKRGDIVSNASSSFDVLTSRVDELDTNYASEPVDLIIRNKSSDSNYGASDSGFKSHSGNIVVKGKGQTGIDYDRDMSYTSVYNNFNEELQIGHVYGTIDRALYDDGKLSTVYAQGKSTSSADMAYMKELSQYNIDNKINDGKVKYEGVATYQENANIEGPLLGKSEFDVDFVDQQVDGKLSFSGASSKDIKAEISGNQFSGSWNGVATKGGFYGDDAALLGGVYSDDTGKGTYGAEKTIPTPVDPVEPVDPADPSNPTNPDVAPDTELTGFQSTALSSKEKTLPFGLGQLENAIGYVAIRDDKSEFTTTTVENGAEVPVDNRQGDNFKSFSDGVVRGDMVQPSSVLEPIKVSLQRSGEVKVDAGKGGSNPTYEYTSVYENFDQQMQIGHVYGNFNSLVGDVSRATNVYVEGYLTNQADIDYLKQVNDGKAQYTGVATYIENIHLDDNTSTAPVNGTSSFDVDFVNNSVAGELAFDGNFKYMPAGNKIGIEATIDGNTFAGNVNGIDTAGGFYGEDAAFLGGIYQDASVEGGKGTVAGTGTKFQGTFGAEKQ